MKNTLLKLITLFSIVACTNDNGVVLLPASAFQTSVDGKSVELYTLKGGDLTMQVTNFGARVVSLWAPDREGRMADVVIGYENIDRYVHNTGERFFGASPGTVANRIGGASFTIGDKTYELSRNDGPNTLHGGFKGIDNLVWDVKAQSDSSIAMEVVHPDGLDGFPGNVTVGIILTLTEDSALKVEFKATTDAPTPVNIAHHSFFNLKGSGEGDILGHVMTINASNTTPIDSLLIPTGEIASVEGTPQDFRVPHTVGERIGAGTEQMRNGNGYDHNWVIDRRTADGIELAATVYEPGSGRCMEVLSDQPGMQFYSGNFFDGSYNDKYGKPVVLHGSLALETQKFPDAVHHDNFPCTILNPGEVYSHTCIYKFSTK